MRNITTSCYSKHAIKVSNSYCSGLSNRVSVSHNLIHHQSILNAVTCIYRAKLSTTHNHFFVRINWGDPVGFGQGFSIAVADNNSSFRSFSKNATAQLPKGKISFECFSNSKIEVLWDLSQAIYEFGPEPVNGFYIMVFVNSEVVLFLGENHKEEEESPEFSLISRNEYFSGNALYSTKARFSDNGPWHEILIKCTVEEGRNSLGNSMLFVSIDNKDVIQVKRLQWNFRGNQTIFVDKLMVDLMWDVHDWFFKPKSDGFAIFLFKTRTGFHGRLWLEDNIFEDKIGFSLLVCACKNPL